MGQRRTKAQKQTSDVMDHPAFGMWKGREDMKDVHAWLRDVRTPRYLRQGGTSPAGLRQSPHARIRMGAKGRVVIPASFRKALDIKIGDELELRIDGGELRLLTLGARLARAQKEVRKLVRPGRFLAKELIAERREEARRQI